MFKFKGAVGIGIDTEQDTLLFCHPAIEVGQIQPDRMRIHFQETAPLSGMTDDTSYVHIVGRSFINEPAAGMGQDCKVGMVHGAQDPFSLLLS
jgi:hypothetical protein